MSETIRNPRIVALLIDRATTGLSVAEQDELIVLLSAANIDDDFSFDSIVALLQNHSVEAEMKPLPDHVRFRVLSDAKQLVIGNVNAGSHAGEAPDEANPDRSGMESGDVLHRPAEAARPVNRREILAWMAAAASLLLTAFFLLTSRDAGAPALIAKSEQHQLDNFLAGMNADRLLMVNLAAGNDANSSKARGTVYWDRQTKRGFIKMVNVAPNQPQEKQYQLWVVDRARGIEDRPNAGVFDIPDAGEHVFAFRSDLAVFDAQGFAVTVEKPGGINKSDLSQIALVNLGS